MDIPWPVQLGIAGGAVAVLISFLVWFIRQLATGYDPENKKQGLITGGTAHSLILAERKSAAELIAAAERRADESIASEKVRGDEWKETALVEREGREEQTEIAKSAVDGLRISDHFFSSMLPKMASKGHTGTEEDTP